MSVAAPCVAAIFGVVAVPQSDVVELQVHLGCTSEVSSFELMLANFEGKYSPNGIYPLSIGVDGSLSIGRGTVCPLLITCHVENIKYVSAPSESYVQVSGRCWGERLFRRVITKTYLNVKGEVIIKDLLDYHVGLSHLRNGAELVEATDTTYTNLNYQDTPVFDIIKYVAETADTQGVIGYDFRIAPDGKFEFFPRGTKANAVNLQDRIENSEYSQSISRVRNKITVYGAPNKSVPADKDAWTESLNPTDGAWSALSGTISIDTTNKIEGAGSIKTYVQDLYYAGCLFTLQAEKLVNMQLFPVLNLWLSREDSYNGNVTVTLFDSSGLRAINELTLGAEKWFQIQLQGGSSYSDMWQTEDGFDWVHIWRISVACWFDNTGTGSFWVDGLFFGGRRFSAMVEDLGSQDLSGLREQVEINEELGSDLECLCRAKATLSSLKDPALNLLLRSTVIDFGSKPILAGDVLHVELPLEGIDANFRVQTIEYRVIAATQTLEVTLELGKETLLLADYMYSLKSRTDSLCRYKAPRRA